MDIKTEELVFNEIKILFSNDYTGHDFEHTKRVYKNALLLSEDISCNKEIIILSALLHDADDPKIFNTTNNQNARNIMAKANIKENIIDEVIKIINKISFKGSGKDKPDSIEGQIVQDADRLDALGAIGIARAFAYGAVNKRKMYDPHIKPSNNLNEENYHNFNGTTINHFFEKLLLLKDLMNTKKAKELANLRTNFMKEFISNFIKEWN